MAEPHAFAPRSDPVEVVRVPLPTPWGTFDVRAFETASGHVYLALVHGDVRGHDGVLTRVHSECLTGDTLGSLRCDCGIQLRLAMRFIAAEDRGVLVYATDHEARGIGLVNKLRAYAMQDDGRDTIDANLALGFPIDARDYGDAARVLGTLGLSSVTLLTNNPDKVRGLREGGIEVLGVRQLATTPHTRNLHYLRTKERKLGHVEPTGAVVSDGATRPPVALDVTALMGEPLAPADRPYVVLKFAQTLDGRIATSTGDAKWISGEDERRVSHALRAASDAVLVGVGTVIQDDPQLTVRMVDGMSPKRVVLDSTLRLPMSAKILDLQAPTCVVTTMRAPRPRRDELQQRGVHVEITPGGPRGVDLEAALASLRASGIETLLVEGGARVITSMLAGGLVDRVIVGVAPTIIGQGTEAVGALGTVAVSEGIRLVDRTLLVLDHDVLLAWSVDSRR